MLSRSASSSSHWACSYQPHNHNHDPAPNSISPKEGILLLALGVLVLVGSFVQELAGKSFEEVQKEMKDAVDYLDQVSMHSYACCVLASCPALVAMYRCNTVVADGFVHLDQLLKQLGVDCHTAYLSTGKLLAIQSEVATSHR